MHTAVPRDELDGGRRWKKDSVYLLMKMIPNSLASATHLTNVYFFIISLFCFSYYLVGQNLVDLYNQTKCVLLASIVSCVFSVGVLGFARSYVAFVDCLIWIMIVRGLQASMPAMEMSDRSKEEEKEQQAHHCCHCHHMH